MRIEEVHVFWTETQELHGSTTGGCKSLVGIVMRVEEPWHVFLRRSSAHCSCDCEDGLVREVTRDTARAGLNTRTTSSQDSVSVLCFSCSYDCKLQLPD